MSLRSLREANGWSLDDMALYTGLSRSMVAMLERGDRTNPSMNTIRAFAEALEMTADEVVKEMEND